MQPLVTFEGLEEVVLFEVLKQVVLFEGWEELVPLERLVFPLVSFYSVEQVQVQVDSLEVVVIHFLE